MSDPVTTCSNCGSPILTSGRFCANCGHVIEAPTEQSPEVPEAASTFQASESDMPDDTPMVSTGEHATNTDGVSASPDSAPAESVIDDSLSGDSKTEVTSQDAVEPQSWYASLSTSPGDDISSDGGKVADDAPEEPALQSEQNQPEEPSTPEIPRSSFTPLSQSTGTEQSTTYAPPLPASEWQPGAYDMGATQPVEIPAASEAPSTPTYEATTGQPQSIFSPPPPPPSQGQYTQPITPQQGYSPPQQAQQAQQAQQQGFTPPPAYSNQGLPPPGTQPLQSGQSYPNYPQSQPGYPPPQQATAKDPTIALMLELLGYLGFLGIGHIYAGKTNRGIALLIGWIVYLTASVVLTFCLVGCFMLIAWLIVPPLSGLWMKNEMEKERMTGFRQ